MRRAPAAAGRVFVLSSPSGGGKTTVLERLLRRNRCLARSVSVTTRAPRAGERDGADYRFVTLSVFRRLRRQGALLESARVHGAYYGTPKAPVLAALAQGRHVALSLDVQGARSIRRLMQRQAVLIFLMPPSREHLIARLQARSTESPAAIRRRLSIAAQEIACARWYDHTVVNDRLPHAVRAVAQVIRSYCKRRHNIGARHGTDRN